MLICDPVKHKVVVVDHHRHAPRSNRDHLNNHLPTLDGGHRKLNSQDETACVRR